MFNSHNLPPSLTKNPNLSIKEKFIQTETKSLMILFSNQQSIIKSKTKLTPT